MTVIFAIASYFVLWWVTLFAVLPIGFRSQQEAGSVTPGTPASAPARPKFLQIILITTVVSAVIFVAVYSAFSYGLIDLRPPMQQPGQT